MAFHTMILVGNLGRDPEMRYTPAGQAVTNFSVAVNDDFKDANGEKIERTIWIRVSTWGKQAEVCNQYLHKGNKVLVEGKLSYDAKTGGPKIYQKNDGTAGASFEVRAQTVRFLSSKADAEAQSGGAVDAGDAEQGDQPAATKSDDIPF